jgi:predicted nucleotidyltransferase
MLRIRAAAGGLVLCWLSAGPTSAGPQGPSPGDASSVEGRLRITRQDAERVEGRFSNAHASGLWFSSLNQGVRAEVVFGSAAKGELLRVTEDKDVLILSAYGGRARTFVDLKIVRESARQGALPEEERTPFAVAEGVREEGDPMAFRHLSLSPEARALPWLSRALGERGLTGRSTPAAMPLHQLALRVAEDIKEQPTPLASPGQSTASSCQDLRSDPNGDNSLGMCGALGTCWEWLCGDCCCHDGCKAHDITCRTCNWYRPWNCILCCTGASFLIGTCGTSCQGASFAESTVVPSGGICGSTSPNPNLKCGGERQSSTEWYAAPKQWACLPAQAGVHRCQAYDPCAGMWSCEQQRCQGQIACDQLYPPLADQADPATRAAYQQQVWNCYASVEWFFQDCVCPVGSPYQCEVP